MTFKELFDVSNRKSAGLDRAGRLPLYNSSGFETALDGAAGSTWLTNQFWAQEWSDGKSVWHPDKDGTVMTQVGYELIGPTWFVSWENQYCLDEKQNLYLRYQLEYNNCRFCADVFTGISLQISSGVANWKEFDINGKLINNAPVHWNYTVAVGQDCLDEIYYEKDQLAPAYWRHSELNNGIDMINDILTGVICQNRRV